MLEMVTCNTSAAGHDMCPSVILLLRSDKVLLEGRLSVNILELGGQKLLLIFSDTAVNFESI